MGGKRKVCIVLVWVFVVLLSSLPSLVHALVSRAAPTMASETSVYDDYIRRGWTQADVKVMKESTKGLKAKLKSYKAATSTGPKQPRPIKIRAEWGHHPTTARTTAPEPNISTDNLTSVTKLIHFQRHGEGYHNLFGFILRDNGIQPDLASKNVGVNPFIRPEIVDSPLTETGKIQCAQRRPEASLLHPQAIIVSPLCRAIDTAKISFADYYPKKQSATTSPTKTDSDATTSRDIPWVVHEGCREDLGVLVCNKRRKWSDILADYPELDFSLCDIETEDDILWEQLDHRETPDALETRIYDFLVNVVMERPEEELAVVTHSGWLFHMCNDVVDCGTDTTLEEVFLTSEIRSMRLTFTKNEDAATN